MPFTMPIESGHIGVFARALGDDNPLYHSADAARAAGLPGIVAPPTFVEAGAHFDPQSIVRPLDGQVWFGSAAGPTGDPGHLDREPGTTFHAETHFEYHQPLLVAGQVLRATERPGSSWSKSGRRGGPLVFRDWFVDYLDEPGVPVVTVRTVSVTTSHKVPPPAGRTGTVEADTFPDIPDSRPDGAPPRRVGEMRERVLLRNLTRTRIVQYAGASGDFSPQHTDEFYNVHAAGYPTVFAHGMLSMGAAGRLLTDWLGVGVLRTFSARFLGQVWPGDSLLGRATVDEADAAADGTRLKLGFQVLDQRGAVVLDGAADALLRP